LKSITTAENEPKISIPKQPMTYDGNGNKRQEYEQQLPQMKWRKKLWRKVQSSVRILQVFFAPHLFSQNDEKGRVAVWHFLKRFAKNEMILLLAF
jgi:hypothetical protein